MNWLRPGSDWNCTYPTTERGNQKRRHFPRWALVYCIFPWGPHRVARNKSDLLLGANSQLRKLPAFRRWFQLRLAISRDLLARRRRSWAFNRGTHLLSSEHKFERRSVVIRSPKRPRPFAERKTTMTLSGRIIAILVVLSWVKIGPFWETMNMER